MTRRAFLIAAPTSGTGKTTISLGIMRALADRGLNVAPFKTGPDYIDTQYHAVAARRPSVNLDTFFTPDTNRLRQLFANNVVKADVAVVEGAMGLFDGYNHDRGSSADVARRLRLPVVMVVNSRSAAFSLAPLLNGFKTFDPDVKIAGVIFNRVGSQRHRAMLADAAKAVGLPVIGMIPHADTLSLPSRHLGLTLSLTDEMDAFAAEAARVVSENTDLTFIEQLTCHYLQPALITPATGRLNISVARDMAFSFIYSTTLDSLARVGNITFFSPLADNAIPADTDILYLPGGYPEIYAGQLSANVGMRQSVAQFAKTGGKILAECGGLIYLCSGIIVDGTENAMCRVLPMKATMENSRLHLGYREVKFNTMTLRGHEFHYSRLINPDALPSAATVADANGNIDDTPVYRYGNVVAGYTHLYLGDTDISKLWTTA